MWNTDTVERDVEQTLRSLCEIHIQDVPNLSR